MSDQEFTTGKHEFVPDNIQLKTNDIVEIDGFRYKVSKSNKLDSRTHKPLMQLKKID